MALGMHGIFFVEAKGKKGGLILIWDESIDVHIKSYSEGHIDCIVREDRGSWRFTGLYGNPSTDQRRFTWELMRRLSDMAHGTDTAWMVGGDLNEILDDREKLGGRPRPPSQMSNFRDALVYCGLNEVPFPDKGFTWFNKRRDEPIYERLDRFLINGEWMDKFAGTSTTLLDFFGSDHRPILCSVATTHIRPRVRGQGRFFFENKWLLEKNMIPDFICEWESMRDSKNITEKLAKCSSFLMQWAKHHSNYNGKALAQMRGQRQEIMRSMGKSRPMRTCQL